MKALLAASLAASLRFAPAPDDPSVVAVLATNTPPGCSLTLHLVREERPGPAMFGEVVRFSNGAVFKPAFSLEPGSDYRARLITPGGRVLKVDYRVPLSAAGTAPQVLRVFPGAKEVPANLLKFYLEFSQPMREGREVFDLIRLEDDQGRVVQSPWRRQELWTDDARRLSLWIHPGRIKRGVNLRESMGPVLRPGRRYRLILDGRLRDANGTPMGRDHVHEFGTREEDHQMPDPRRWRLEAPAAGTVDALRVIASEPLDHALLRRCQWVEDVAGERVSARIEIAADGLSWRWFPERPWRAGSYRLCVDEWLEDLAGNTPARPFERDVDEPETDFELVRVSFEIR